MPATPSTDSKQSSSSIRTARRLRWATTAAAIIAAALTMSSSAAVMVGAEAAAAPPLPKAHNLKGGLKASVGDSTVAPALPELNVSPNTITLSGFDSGAIFANQMQIAHSKMIKAAGLVSGVPFLCSEGTLVGASACMLNPLAIMNSALIAQALVFQGLGMIDDVSNLGNQYTMVFGAPLDTVVGHLATERMVEMLSSLGGKNIDTIYNYSSAGHAWITDNDGNNPCSYNGSPYINDCGFAFGTQFLKKAMGFMGVQTTPLMTSTAEEKKKASVAAAAPLPDLILFNQAIFGADATGNSMDAAGLAFIPPQCYASAANTGNSGNGTAPVTCHLHLHFHGCQQSRSSMGTGYASRTGLNTQWAVDNNIIILYPQATPNALKYNPMGCWDWFNYNNENFYTNWGEFATKNGVQIRIIKHLINSVLAGE